MKQKFTVTIPCKKYIKAYLENNCGSPVNLKHLPDLQEILRNNLQRMPDPEVKTLLDYSDKVAIIIPEDMFFRYGFELPMQAIVTLNKEAEAKIKFAMRTYITLNYSLGLPVTECIKNFQDDFGISEVYWPYQSIRKDFYRHGVKKIKSIDQVSAGVKEFLRESFINAGVVTVKKTKGLWKKRPISNQEEDS
jgi:hypothetical protein